jgi:uncharacterized protein (DUF1501 family)
MLSRRHFTRLAGRFGAAALTAPLWQDFICAKAFANVSNGYRAVILITLEGGNDGNNMLVPLDSGTYAQYAALRTALAIPQGSLNILSSKAGAPSFGLHPALTNIARLYNSGDAAIVANVGPLATPLTKAQILSNPALAPEALLSHPAGVNQWESASAQALPSTGWGGRIADLLVSQSGSLPPLFDSGGQSIFTVGRSVQAISISGVGGKTSALPMGIQDAMLAIATNDSLAPNKLVAAAAALRVKSEQQSALIAQAQASGSPLMTSFPGTGFGQAMSAVASLINGRSVIGASRQIFYAQQGEYDTHSSQLGEHNSLLSELDQGLAAMMLALEEMGLSNQVLVCTHSDFNRTILSNTVAGSDHAWGNHQLILGGGISGGRIIGTFPDLDLGGSMDLNGYGTWIPTLSVSQMAGGIGSWMGLTPTQVSAVFPDLINFPTGPINL